MNLEIDILKLEEQCRSNYEDDKVYRSMLETSDLTSEEIDSIVRRHYSEVAAQIECRECGNCCRVFCPPLTLGDIDRLARLKKTSRDDLIEKYLAASGDGEAHSIKSSPCPFLDGNECSVYADRPEACRAYPGLDRPGFLSRISYAFSNCSVCPIVYHVYERVKREILTGEGTESGP
jgi:Fe-S-cluster containining protein